MKKVVIMAGITLAIIITLSLWCCCVVASESDDQMEEMMRKEDQHGCERVLGTTEETGQDD